MLPPDKYRTFLTLAPGSLGSLVEITLVTPDSRLGFRWLGPEFGVAKVQISIFWVKQSGLTTLLDPKK